ncbi:MAG: diguanylate cyclase [Deltaproteobacteria bacterium]|jgi:diguanylate cyclase (GGDEF)-like protein|nr:diguanylate cyclase [Deltaproteobacteria bacterium]
MDDIYSKKQQDNKEKHLLVVDDEKHIRSSIKRAFYDKYKIHEAKSGEEGLQILQSGLAVDILLVDMFMPGGMNGIEFFEKAIEITPRSGRILMTGRDEVQIALKAVNKGHINYFIKKPWDIQEMANVFQQMEKIYYLEKKNELLVLELKYSNSSLKEANQELKKHKELLRQSLNERSYELLKTVRKLEEANKKLKKEATRDSLTGLYNHKNIKTRLKEELARAVRYKSQLSILFCDIDHFKTFNDNHGHDIGDEVLATVSNFLINGSEKVPPSRKSDIIGRYGGEEFVLILPETNKVGAKIRGERIREGITKLPVTGAQSQPLGFLSVSIGISTFPEDSGECDKLLQIADKALYKAKNSGRNRVITN